MISREEAKKKIRKLLTIKSLYKGLDKRLK